MELTSINYPIDYDFSGYTIENNIPIMVYLENKDISIGYIENIIKDKDNNSYIGEVSFIFSDITIDSGKLFPVATIDKNNNSINIERFILIEEGMKKII